MSTPHPAGDATRAERSACVSRKLAAEAALERVRPGLERGVSAAQAAAARADEAARQAGEDLHEKLNALRREVGIVPLRATP